MLFGANAALPHASASATKRLEAGEFALFDVGGRLVSHRSPTKPCPSTHTTLYLQMGYESDFTRTMLPDSPSASSPWWRRLGCSGHSQDLKREWPDARARKIWETVSAAQKAALHALVDADAPDGVVLASAADRAAREVIAAEGWGKYFSHRLGHGIGLQVSDAVCRGGVDS